MGKFGGGAKLLHFFMLLISLGLLSLITRNLGARSPWTGLAFLSIPAAAILACWAFTDMFLVAYFLAFVYVCIRSIKHPHRWGGAPIALMIGAGLGLKYTMLPLIGVLGFVWAALYWIAGNKLSPARRIRTILVAGLGGLLLGSPWYIRNWVNTGNPFYPLAYGIFGDGGGIHRRGEWSAANAEFYLSKAAEKGVHLGLEPGWLSRLIELFISPFTTTFRFQNFEQHIIGVIPLFAVIVLIVAFIAWLAQGRPGDRTQKLVWGFAASALVASWLLWFFTYQSNRLLLPTFALAIAMAAPVAAGWMRHGPRWISCAVHTLTGLGIALGLAILIMLMGSPERVEGWKTGIGLQRPEIYLAGRLNYYEAARWASKNLAARQPSHRILLVGEHRGMYWEIPTTHSDWFDTPQPLPWIRASIDNDAMLDAMLEQKISWIYLNGDELRLYHDDFFKPRFTPEEYTRFESLWRNPRLKPIWQNRTGTQLIFEIGMK